MSIEHRVIDDEGNEVARLRVSGDEAQDIVDAWNKDDSPMRWNKPFQLIRDRNEDLPAFGGTRHCEDYPCCGHEWGDCDGSKYGSDEEIKRRVHERIASGDDDHPDWGEE